MGEFITAMSQPNDDGLYADADDATHWAVYFIWLIRLTVFRQVFMFRQQHDEMLAYVNASYASWPRPHLTPAAGLTH